MRCVPRLARFGADAVGRDGRRCCMNASQAIGTTRTPTRRLPPLQLDTQCTRRALRFCDTHSDITNVYLSVLKSFAWVCRIVCAREEGMGGSGG